MLKKLFSKKNGKRLLALVMTGLALVGANKARKTDRGKATMKSAGTGAKTVATKAAVISKSAGTKAVETVRDRRNQR
jgi:hypothetical protein